MFDLTRWSDDFTSDELVALERSTSAAERELDSLEESAREIARKQAHLMSVIQGNDAAAMEIVKDIEANEEALK